MYRWQKKELELFLVHPGGPYWAKKDNGAWSIPKGLFQPDNEAPLEAAQREFTEETGCSVKGRFISLDSLKQPSGKIIYAWAIEGFCDAADIVSNTFSMEWPPHSGRQQEFPEVDRAAWFTIESAKKKLVKGQVGFIHRLLEKLEGENA